MYKLISVTCIALALSHLASAVPASNTARTLHKRDTCDLRGWHQVEIVVGSGGPGQAPVSYTTGGFDLYYEGGVFIGSASEDDLNPIKIGGITIPDGALGQPGEIQWDPAYDLTSYSGCSATYSGVTSEGVTDSCSDTTGTSCSQCTVKIPCAGGLV